jgi:hypothetical protein
MIAETKILNIDDITLDDRLQMRAKLDADVIDDYSDKLDKLPDVKVILDTEGKYWLTDGWHRIEGARKKKRKTIRATVRVGTFADAVIESIQSNMAHGLRFTAADKKRSVQTLLTLDEFRTRTDHAIAELAGVSHTFVSNIRKSLKPKKGDDGKRTGRDGRTFQQAKPVLCDRCVRVGQTKDCKTCAELREKVGKKPRQTKDKSGTLKFDFSKFHSQFTPIAQAATKLVKAYPEEKGCDEFKKCEEAIELFIRTWNGWQKRIIKGR